MKTSIFALAALFSLHCSAEIRIYKNTDNTGINKLERIGVIETYLSNLSGTLKAMEAKLDATDLKLKTLDTTLSALKENDLKKIQDQLTEQKAAIAKPQDKVSMEELEKLKEDMLTLKNDDIEAIRQQILILKSGIDEIKFKQK